MPEVASACCFAYRGVGVVDRIRSDPVASTPPRNRKPSDPGAGPRRWGRRGRGAAVACAHAGGSTQGLSGSRDPAATAVGLGRQAARHKTLTHCSSSGSSGAAEGPAPRTGCCPHGTTVHSGADRAARVRLRMDSAGRGPPRQDEPHRAYQALPTPVGRDIATTTPDEFVVPVTVALAALQTAKNEAGLDHCQVRSWRAWERG